MNWFIQIVHENERVQKQFTEIIWVAAQTYTHTRSFYVQCVSVYALLP